MPMLRRLARLSLLALTALTLAQPSLAAGTPGTAPPLQAAAAFTRGEPLPAWALPFADLPTTQRTDPLVIRVAETQIRLGSEHGVEYLVSRALQVNDASALSQVGQYPLYFVPAYQRVRLHAVRLLRGGQVLDRTASANLRFLDREHSLEQGIYSGMVTAVLLLDDVRVGDTLHLVYTLQGRNPVLGSHYSHSLAWDHGDPVELRRATLIAPRERRIAWALHGDHRPANLKPQELSAPDAPVRVLRFEERSLAAVDEEPSTPDHFLAARFLQLTEHADWNSVARWAAALFPADAPLPPEMQPLLAQWREITDPMQRAGAALRWVQEEIRYFSVSLGESSHRPSSPAEVLQRRYGDCKDKTLLLVSLLRALGLEADPALVASNSPKLPQRLLPHPDAFDHVVAQLRLGGRSYWLDPTRLGQRGRLDRLGVHEGATALVVHPDTRGLTELHSADPLGLATQELDERFTVLELGGAGRLQMRYTWHGTNAELMRLAFARMSGEQRRRQVMGGYDRRYPGIRLLDEPTLHDDTEGNRFSVQANFEVPAMTRLQDGRWLLRFYADPVANAVRLPENFERRFPAIVASVPTQARYRVSVQWPDSVSVLRPADTLRVPSDFFVAEVQRSFRANLAELQMEVAPRQAELRPAQLPQLAEDLRRLERAVGGVVLVEADAVKRDGFLGIGRRGMADSTAARLDRQIVRNTWAIDGGQLSGDELAEALCDRAEARAERGQAAAGLADAERAAREAPELGRAHACLGQLLFANGRFRDAVVPLTKALTLGHEAAGLLYQRGHARFYAGDYVLAAQDFGKAAALHARRPRGEQAAHAQLWQAWALKRAGLPLPADWAQTQAEPWPRKGLAVAAGTLAPEHLISELKGQLHGDALQLALAEAWFHLGQHYRASGDGGRARQAFENARSQALPVALEHLAAGFELAAAAPASH